MGNQKYIISSLLVIIVVLLGFAAYLVFLRSDTSTTDIKTQMTKTKQAEQNKKAASVTPKRDTNAIKSTERSASQPEVYLGYKVSIPKNVGCINIGQYDTNKKPSQEDMKDNLTEEQLMIFQSYILNGWTFQQACKADDYTFAYSLYNKDRSNRYLSNNMIISFVEDKVSLNYYKDEKINKPKEGSEICTIYKLTKTFLDYSCNTNDGVKKWQLPFDQKSKTTSLN